MTLVYKPETDMFRLASIADIMVNPVNTLGAMGKGIAKEFKERHPEMYLRYKKVCLEGKLRIGKIHVVKDTSVNYKIVSLPTKEDWRDASRPEYIEEGLRALRRYLEKPENKYMTVIMPMLGCGEGKLGYEVVDPLFREYLDDLTNIVIVCKQPAFMDHLPKYLGIVGPRVFGAPTLPKSSTPNPQYQEQKDCVLAGVDAALKSWGLTYSDFDGIVSGGADGVDRVACGMSYEDPLYPESIASRHFGNVRPFICFADWDRRGLSAGMKRNYVIADIATHIVAFLPDGIRSIGTVEMVKLIRRLQGKYPQGDYNHPELIVVGNDVLPTPVSIASRI